MDFGIVELALMETKWVEEKSQFVPERDTRVLSREKMNKKNKVSKIAAILGIVSK